MIQGSTYSLLPENLVPSDAHFKFVDIKIAGWNGSPFTVTKTVDLSLSFTNINSHFNQTFLVAPTAYPILGADFLHRNNVSINSAQMKLFIDQNVIEGEPLSSSRHCLSIIDYHDCPLQIPSHSIELTSIPKSQRFRPLSGDKLAEVRTPN